MSIEQNMWIQESQQITNQAQSPSKCFFSQFQHKFETIKAFAEDLRQLQIQITAKEDSQINGYTGAIVNYLSHPGALSNEKLYRNSLIGLGNFLSIKFAFFRKQFLSQKFFKNLIEYFSILCQKENKQDFNMLVYPIFYFIVLVIYNSDKDFSNALYSKLFTKKFIRALCSVNFQKGNRVQRYLPVIIAFIAKGLNHLQNLTDLKQLILSNIHFSEIEKNHFHFIYSLRVLINKQSFSIGQVRRYKVLDYLVQYLSSNSSQQHITMILQILKHILKRHQILGYKIIQINFFNVIQKVYKVSPSQTLSLLEIVSPCLPYSYKQKMFKCHSNTLLKSQNQFELFVDQKQLQSLKIVSMIIEEIQFNQILSFLQNFSVQLLLKRCLKGEKKLENCEEQIIIGLVSKILKCVMKFNESIGQILILSIYHYKQQSRKLSSVLDQFESSEFLSSYELR